MGISEKIRILMVKRGDISAAELSRKLQAEGFPKLGPQNLSNKLKRETFDDDELQAIAKVLGAKYTRREYFTLDDTGEEI
jgi:SOS response regulatory protein OraA/RecX